MSPFVSRNAVNGSCIARFPEEILHRILSYSVSVPPAPLLRPSWHVRQKSCNRSRTATLLVCKSWLRIATPLFYTHILLQSEEQAALLSHTVTANPILARYARSLKVMGVWGVLRDVIKLCSSVESLDLTLDAPRIVDTDCRMQEIGKALSDLELLDIRHFVLRKLPNAYITQQKPRFVISHLSLLVPKWQRLVSALSSVVFRHFGLNPASYCRNSSTSHSHFQPKVTHWLSRPRSQAPQDSQSCARSSRWCGAQFF